MRLRISSALDSEHKMDHIHYISLTKLSYMENIALNRLMRLLNPLSSELKLELITMISESLKFKLNKSKSEKEALLEELSGSWSDVEGHLAEDIINARSISDRDISFD